MIGRVPGEYVREPRLDTDPDEGEQAGFLPALVLLELPVSELDARLLVRALRMRLGKRHRHVEIRAARGEGGGEDRRIQARIGRVHDHVGLEFPGRRDNCALVRGIECERRETIRLLQSRDRTLSAAGVQVGESHVVEEGPVLGDRRDGRSNAPRTDHQHVHSPRGSTIPL